MNSKKICKFKQSRNWAFTDFQFLDFTSIYNEFNDIIRYICWGEEICPSTGRKHYQGWIQFYNKKTRGGVQRICRTKKLSVRACYASEYYNDNYCKKDGKYTHFGKFIIQGQRSDLEEIRRKIDNNEPDINIAKEYFSDYIRYYKGFEAYRKLVEKKNSKEFRHIKTYILFGPSGTGKTRTAIESSKDKDYYMITGDQLKTGWFDGYKGEKTLIIDEYDTDVPITKMLNILDGYQLRLPKKGGFTYANWKRVYITSNINPTNWHFHAKEEHRNAFFRRIHKIYDFTPKYINIIKYNPPTVKIANV